MNPLDQPNLTNSETRYDGELPSLELALQRTGLFAGVIYRQVIEKELDKRQARIKELEAAIEKIRRRMGASSR